MYVGIFIAMQILQDLINFTIIIYNIIINNIWHLQSLSIDEYQSNV